ncbi:MAG: hypothetical protein R6T93_10255, partial [Trueperaceae bacterium]
MSTVIVTFMAVGTSTRSPAGSLPRGILVWDDDLFDWVEVGDSTDLVLRWSFVDAASDTHTASITIDWG